MSFRASPFSNKTGECRRIAQHIAAAACVMGLSASVEESRQSASHYVYVSASAEAEDRIKIRCSDHHDKHGGSDWHTWAGECPSDIIAQLAAHFDRAIPVGYRSEDYATRASAAARAAATRASARRADEAEMVRAIIEALRQAKSTSTIAAGKLIDDHFPGVPRAQRQRIAYGASRIVTRDRAIARAGDNVDALVSLGRTSRKARIVLLELVGSERFAALRPSGFPRCDWKV